MFQIENGRHEFYRWDLNQRLIVEDDSVVEVHFCNKTDECSLVVDVYEEDGKRLADVPNILLQDIWSIHVYAFCCSIDSEYTKVEKVFNVHNRTKPYDYVYTETEVHTYNELDERITYIEEHPGGADLSNYYTKEETDANFMTPAETGEAFTLSIDEMLEVGALVDAEYVDNAVDSAIAAIPEVDLTNYYTKNETDAAIDVAISEIEIPSGGVGAAGTGQGAEVFNNTARNVASGQYSHAEGSWTTASADEAHAEGYGSKATASMAHAEGQGTQANGQASHSEGLYTIAAGMFQHVQGKYNEEDTEGKYAHIVGGGYNIDDMTIRSNIHTLDWDGNAWFEGNVTVGSNNDALVTEARVLELIEANIPPSAEEVSY